MNFRIICKIDKESKSSKLILLFSSQTLLPYHHQTQEVEALRITLGNNATSFRISGEIYECHLIKV